MKLYREFTTQEALDAAYNPSTTAADAAGHMASWTARSAATLERLQGEIGVRYGPTLAEYCDVFPAGASSSSGKAAPVHLFVHGGYWRRFSARDFAWVAEPLVRAGMTAVIVNYALCPKVTLTEIVRQVRAAIAWCRREIHRFGGDAERLTIAGHSAGGHLVGMALATDWQGDYSLDPSIAKGAIAVSGLFDLRPFPYTYLQPALQLTTRETLELSPVDLTPKCPVPLIAAVGGAESAEFRRQSRELVQSWQGKGGDCRYTEIEGADHFTALDHLFDPASDLFARLLAWGGAGLSR